MTRRVIALIACALIACVAIVRAAPVETEYEITTTTVWADTLPRGFVSDSTVYTAPVNVFGARSVMIDAQTSGAGGVLLDTLSVGHPIFDVTGRGVYTGAGGSGSWNALEGVTLGNIPLHGSQIYLCYGTPDMGLTAVGGTPFPITTRFIKFRMLGGDTRRYLGASLTNLAPTGTITVRVHVVR